MIEGDNVKNVLFVCTGNTCRSPMAEMLLKHLASDRYNVKSAGIVAMDGQDAYPHVNTVLQNRGIQTKHSSQRTNTDLLEWADIILTMTQGHKGILIQQHPEIIDKVMTLKESVQNDEERDRWQQAVADFEMKRVLYEKAINDGQPTVVVKEKENDVQMAREHIHSLDVKDTNIDVEDPYGGSLETYEKVCRELEMLLEQFVQKYV